MMRSDSRLAALTKNLALALASVCFSLVLAEIILRVFYPISWSMEIEYIPDGYLGARLQPNRVYTLK
jgi:hypothetical protein